MASWVEKKASHIDVIIFDVDGVLTRGDITYGPEGETKSFNVLDGHAFVMAKKAGLKICVVSARKSEPVKRRMTELPVDEFLDGQSNKATSVKGLLQKMGIRPTNAAYVGDDLVDLPAMGVVGLSVAVANAVDDVKERAAHITKARGGEGAAREVIELVLRARGVWSKMVQEYVEQGREK